MTPSTRTAELDVVTDVERGLTAGEFELWYQPSAKIADGQIDGVEALVRWRHPDHGLIAPGLFLPVVERSEIAWPFTKQVVEQAVQFAKYLEAGTGLPLRVDVNISANLLDRRLPSVMARLLSQRGVPPSRVGVEVTETAVMEDAVTASRTLDRLAEMGIGRIAIDDFGTGYSSLGRLRDLRIDALKVDRSFVSELCAGADPAFVRSMIDLAHYLDLTVVAEGIEDEQTWRLLAQLGCDVGQGYWLSRPLPPDRLLNWLRAHESSVLASYGVVTDRREGAGRRALDRIAGAFASAPEAMLMSDPDHRWSAVNDAAAALLEVNSEQLLDRHIDELARGLNGAVASALLASVAGEPRTGICQVKTPRGQTRRLRFELRRSMVPGHHVWILTRDD